MKRFVHLAVWILILPCGVAQRPATTPLNPQRQAALSYEQQGKLGESESTWRSYLKTHHGDPEPYAHLALLAARQERYGDAIPLYRKALVIDPHLPTVRLDLGLALFKSGNLKQAILEFTQVLKAVPPDSAQAQRMVILLGMSHYGLAEYSQAVPLLRRAAARDAQNLPLRFALAHSCLWSKQYQCVLNVYHQILLLNAESAEADMLAGEALDEMKDQAGAIAQFRAAEKANPNEPLVHFGLGYLYWSQRRYDEAEAEFNLELANDPNHARSMLYLGDLYLQSSKPEQAAPWLQKAVQLDPSLWRAQLDLGILESDAGHLQEALKLLGSAVRLNPSDVNIHWRLARLYQAMGRKDEAKAEFAKAKSMNKTADEELLRKMSSGQAKPVEMPGPQTPPKR